MATDLLPTMHSIDFASKAENIHLVEQMIDSVCEEQKVAEDHYGNILIAMTEAVNNAIHHGNGLNPNKKTSVSFDALTPLMALIATFCSFLFSIELAFL